MKLKKLLSAVTATLILFCFASCGTSDNPSGTESRIDAVVTEAKSSEQSDSSGTETTATPEINTNDTTENKALILYFSCTGTTKSTAEEIKRLTGADIIEILPETPYTTADLDYSGDCRANREQKDSSSRPKTTTVIDNLSDYDTIFIGFPIWWGTMPKIINTVLDTYDFSEKTLIPFCTSGSSGISEAVSAIKAAEPNSEVKEGLRAGSLSQIAEWLEDIGFLI